MAPRDDRPSTDLDEDDAADHERSVQTPPAIRCRSRDRSVTLRRHGRSHSQSYMVHSSIRFATFYTNIELSSFWINLTTVLSTSSL